MKKYKNIKLKRELGLLDTTLCGVGVILGAGIYALIGKAAGIAGNAVWISFAIAAFVAALTGLSYAELSSMFPKAGAEYEYTRKAIGRKVAFVLGWMIISGGLFSGATVAYGFAGYFNALFGTPILLTALVLIILLSALIFYGIKQSVKVAIALTIIEAAGLFIIIFIGLPYIGSVNYLEVPSIAGMFSAAALIFFAFIGFEDIVRLSEETKNPQKTIPKALILAIIITTIMYMFVAISAISVLGWERLSTSDAPLADVASAAFGTNAFVILAVAALFSTANTVLLLLLATSRIMYGMSCSGSLPKRFSYVHKKTRTPWISIIFVAVISLIFIALTNIELAASVTDFSIFVTFFMINISLIILRYRMPRIKDTFRTPLNIGKFPVLALLGAIFSIALMASLKPDAILYGILLIFSGIVAFEIYEIIKGKKLNK
jgi:APA family basic amino acid/polyamine antiporter